MIIHALLSRSTAGVLTAVAQTHTIAQVSTQDRDRTATLSELSSLSQLTPDVLIVAADAGPADALITGLRQYRIRRPEVRIILLAPGRTPGDPLISTLVGLSIYDVLSDEGEALADSLRTALASPPATYAQAARWHTLATTVSSAAPSSEREILRVMTPTARPLWIAVCGITPASGATTLAWAIARELALQGLSTTCFVALNHQHLAAATAVTEPGLPLVFHPSPPDLSGAERLSAVLAVPDGVQVVVLDLGPLTDAMTRDNQLLLMADHLVISWPLSPLRFAVALQTLQRAHLSHVARAVHVAYLCHPDRCHEAIALLRDSLSELTSDPLAVIPVPLTPSGPGLQPLLNHLAPISGPRSRFARLRRVLWPLLLIVLTLALLVLLATVTNIDGAILRMLH